MFNDNDRPYLIRRLKQNQVSLFLGAGFSTLATNRVGRPFPVGRELSELIWSFLGLQGPYDGADLKDLFELLSASNKPQRDKSWFLERHLLTDASGVPQLYNALATIYWRYIFTINVDNIIPVVYRRTGGPRLEVVAYPEDDPIERDQLLDSIQVIYLHGQLPCTIENLIFSRQQYAQNSLLYNPLYQHFVQEYCTQCMIFVGTSWDNQLVEHYVKARQMRGRDITEGRSRSFLIDPDIPQYKRMLLKEFNVVAIEATVEEFLEWLSSLRPELPPRDDILIRRYPALGRFARAPSYSLYQSAFKHFASSFNSVPTDPRPVQRSFYLLGAAPTWHDVHAGLAAPRAITETIIDTVESHIAENSNVSIYALLGSAGSGKSTILKTIGLRLGRQGKTVFHTDAAQLPAPEDIADTLTALACPVVLLFDNAEVVLRELPLIATELAALPDPVVIVISARLNLFDRMTGTFGEETRIRQFIVPDLRRSEIVALLRILESNGKLGYLQGLPPAKRVNEFERRSNKQILVAMREATEGKGFDEIIDSEFSGIHPQEARLVCLCVALASASGFSLTMSEIVGCSDVTSAATIHYVKRNLKGILLRSGPDLSLVSVRHQQIAEQFVKTSSSSRLLRTAYLKVLNVLAPRINRSKWNSRVFQLYRDLINHNTVYVRFYGNVDNARDIYDNLRPYFDSNSHFWLQYGSLEMEVGRLDLAGNYLKQAQSIAPRDNYVTNALGNLELKKALAAETRTRAMYFREEGERILRQQIENIGHSNSYCYHILGLQLYNWVKRWIQKDNEKKAELEAILDILGSGMANHPLNRRLRQLHACVKQAYLNMAIAIEDRPPDPSYALDWRK